MLNAKKNHKVGLAVILGVVNKKGPQGADLDIKNIKTTFENLNYATWVIKNPTPTIIDTVVKIVSEFNYYSIELKVVVLYYAGHGGSVHNNPYILLPSDNDKNERVFIDQRIISPFKPSNPNCHLDDRKRLFLIDCCLKEDNAIETLPTTASRPLNPYLPCYQPSNDYIISAYSTDYKEVCCGYFSKGGVWTFALCDNINQYARVLNIVAILTKVRLDVIRLTEYAVQGPFFILQGDHYYLVDC